MLTYFDQFITTLYVLGILYELGFKKNINNDLAM